MKNEKNWLHSTTSLIKLCCVSEFLHYVKVWPNWATLLTNVSDLTCSLTMLPNFATLLANKFRSKNVRGMFIHAQKHFRKHLLLDGMLSNLANVLANNSSHSCKSNWRSMRNSLQPIVTSTSLTSKWRLNQTIKG